MENITKKIKKIFKHGVLFFVAPLLFFIYSLSFLSPRKNNILVFGSSGGKKFIDNPKYLFLHISNSPKYKKLIPVWITKNKENVKKLKSKKYKAYYYLSTRGIYYTLRAKYFIFDNDLNDINYWISGRSKKINLWHGIALKKIKDHNKKGEFSLQNKNLFTKLILKFSAPWIFSKPDLVLSTSSAYQKIFSSAFNIKPSRAPITGYPRNDIFYKNIEGADIGSNASIKKTIKINKENKKARHIIYLPTFRDDDRENKLFFSRSGIDFKKLNQVLEKINTYLIIKTHLSDAPETKDTRTKNKFNRLIFLESRTDIYPLLPLMDILITDYSSVAYDFLLLNKPIIFFPFDLDNFLKQGRGIYFNYHDFTPGKKVQNFKDLLKAITYITKKGGDSFAPSRTKIAKIVFASQGGNSSDKTIEAILSI